MKDLKKAKHLKSLSVSKQRHTHTQSIYPFQRHLYTLGIVPWDADDNLLASSCLIPVTANIIDLGGRDVGVNLTGPEISCSTMIISAPNQTLANQYSSSIKGYSKHYLKNYYIILIQYKYKLSGI